MNAIAAQPKEGFANEYGEENQAKVNQEEEVGGGEEEEDLIQIAYEEVSRDDFDYLEAGELQAAAKMQREDLDEQKHM